MANFSYQQFKRLAYIDSMLRTGKFSTAQELANPFGCSTRTIERDVTRLRDDFGAPLYFDHYHILNYQGDWYVFGYCHWRQDWRDFALTRIQHLRLLEQTFSISPHFDKDTYLKRQFGIEKGGASQEVILKFSARQARWMNEKVWHHTEQKLPQPDGTLILKMQVPVTSELNCRGPRQFPT